MAGCDVDVIDCDKEPDAKICQPDDEDEDAGDERVEDEDAEVDAGKLDGGPDASKDGGGNQDAANDGSSDGAAMTDGGSITVDEFCVALFTTAVKWRDELEALCGPANEVAAREDFLELVLRYGADDAEGKCIAALNAPVEAGKATFDGSKATACADSFAGAFLSPPDPFPTSGVDLAMYEAKIGHGAPPLIQIPVCRATFKGKLARDATCSDNFECVDGLRCLEAPGGGRTCQTARIGGTCTASPNCADGYTCVGSPESGGGKTCVKNDALPLSGGNCQVSAECATDYICNASFKCANPIATVICR